MRNLKICNRRLWVGIIFSFVISGCHIYDPEDDTVRNHDYSASESFAYTIELQHQNRFAVDGINGPVTIETTASNQIEIHGERRVESESTYDAKRHLDNLEVRLSESSDQIAVQTIQPDESDGRNYLVEYIVQVPAHLNVRIDLVNGNVQAGSLSGSIRIEVVNGEVYLEDTRGNLDAELTNGTISGKVRVPVNGRCEMDIVNGLINLQISTETSAKLSARVTNGNIQISQLDLKNPEFSQTSARGTLGSGNGEIQLKTVNGNIQVSGF